MIKIEIKRERGSIKQIQELLDGRFNDILKTKIIVQKQYRSISPEILVATIAGTSLILREIIKGLIAIKEKLIEKRIVMEFEDASRLEVSGDIKEDELDSLIKKLEKKNEIKIVFKY